MTRGVMLIRVSSKMTPDFIHAVKKIEGVSDAYSVFGRFDAVVFIEGKNFPEMKNVAIKSLKNLETMHNTFKAM